MADFFGSVWDGVKKVGGAVGRGLGIEEGEDYRREFDPANAANDAYGQRGIEQDAEDRARLKAAYQRAADRAGQDPGIRGEDVRDPGQRSVSQIEDTPDVQSTSSQSKDVDSYERASSEDVEKPKDVGFYQGYRAVDAPELGDAKTAGYVGTERTGVDRAATNAARGDIAGAAIAIKNAPGSAAAAFRAALLKTQEAQLGAASQARGGERAGARREAVLGMGRDAMEAAERTSAIEAKEKQDAARGYADVLTSMRSQDSQIETDDARIQAERARTDSTIESSRLGANADRGNSRDSERAKTRLSVDVANREHETDLQKFRTGVNEGNVTRGIGVETGNKDRAAGTSKFNAQGENTRREGNAGRETDVGVRNADRSTDVANKNTDRKAGVRAANSGARNQAYGQEYDTRTSVETGNKERRLRGQEANEGAISSRTGQAIGAAGAIASAPSREGQYVGNKISIAGGKSGAGEAYDKRANEAGSKFTTFLTETGAKVFSGGAKPPTTSDERVKQDVDKASTSDLKKLTDAFTAATFRYKGEYDDGEKHAGAASAQDLEKTKLGKGLVSKDENGVRKVDRVGLAMLLAAAAAKSARQRSA